MKWVLSLLAVLVFLLAGLVLAQANSAIHEIESFLLFIMAAVFLVGAALLESLGLLRKELRKELRRTTEEMTKQLPR